MPSNKKEYMKEYMRKYVKECESICCDVCQGKYKKYNKYSHLKTNKHILALHAATERQNIKFSDEEIQIIKDMLESKRETPIITVS
jgi:hypothetical protein